MQRYYPFTHAPIEFHFSQTPRDFVVEEIPLYPFSGQGEHLIIKLRKKHLSTFELIDTLSSHLGIKSRDIGYAGLKDKHAMTIQHVSIPARFREQIEHFSHQNIKILSTTLHDNKIRIGHLKGNRFFIRIKKVSPLNSMKITQVLEQIRQWGIPNYFGFQRFGNDGNNYEIGRDIAHGKRKMAKSKRREFLLSAYQSWLFNEWLSERVRLSKMIREFDFHEISELLHISKELFSELKSQKHLFVLLQGDLLHHYPHGRIFALEDSKKEAERFLKREITPTGILSGIKTSKASGIAREIEAKFDDECIKEQGTRRFAWIFPEDIEYRYIQEEAHGELHFYLPKGSYATVLLEAIMQKELIAPF